ncbi:hypothetical protein [Acinetobacter variabilis]|uniref:hypothetical protein n=1 Tax=Acinetobacter variabilis TaxID=70346 RepID=UPI003D7675CE
MFDEVEYETYFEELIDELDILLSHLDEELDLVAPNLNLLNNRLNYDNLPIDLFSINKHLFNSFLSQLKAYNEIHEQELFNNLESQAKIINSLLLTFSNSESLYKIKNNNFDEDQYEKLKNNLNNLKSQQDEILKFNKKVLNSYQDANRIISDLKSKNSAYSQLIDEDSNARILKLYNDIYDREIVIADKYRNWALIIFTMVGILVVLTILFTLVQNSFAFFYTQTYSKVILGWDSLIKALMLFSLTTPAWYLTRESSKHRKVAYKAQMLGTELASFPLYAREFKDEDRLELRKHLADRFFGQELYNVSKTNSNSDNSIEQIKLLTETNKVLAESLKIKKSVEGS